MNPTLPWRRLAAVFLTGIALLLGACSTPPAFQVSEPTARVGTVVSITQDTVQNVNTGGRHHRWRADRRRHWAA